MDDYEVKDQMKIDDNIMANNCIQIMMFFICLTVAALILHWAGVI